MSTSTREKTSLAYKDDGNNQNQDNDQEEELSAISLLIRIILIPILLPFFMCYVYFYARGTPIAAELDELEVEQSDSDDDSDGEDERESVYTTAIKFIKYDLLRLKKPVELDAYTFSYEDFRKTQAKKDKQRLNDELNGGRPLAPYIAQVDVARTDRLVFDENGVFIRNIFVPLTDVKTLEKLLKQIEDEALAAQGEDIDEEEDEWAQPTLRGESKRVIKELLEAAKLGKPYHPNKTLSIDRSKISATSSPSPKKGLSHRKSMEETKDGSVDDTSRKSSANNGNSGESGSIKKNKPRKTPLPDNTPLSERLNPNALVGKVNVVGPSMQHVPAHLMSGN